jgi:negative regulator of flagellin synthesis FlgM
MNINPINPSKVVNFYNAQTKKLDEAKVDKISDSIEISSVGKNMSLFSLEDDFTSSDKKIEQLKSQVENGTYNKDSKLIADKMFDSMKGNIR